MGDISEGNSTAAQSAPDEQDHSHSEPRKPGFLRRLMGVIKPSDPNAESPGQATGNLMARPGLINLRNMRVYDVMIPKADIVSVAVSISLDDLVGVFRESGMTRLPVYDGTLDNPQGMIHLKDFSLRHGFNGTGSTFDLVPMLRPLLYVPASMPIGILLQKMQSQRTHMALVIDEYGGVDGLVTIEDLIEQVIGQIEDEHDTDEDKLWTLEKPGQYIAVAKAPLDAFEAEAGVSLTAHDDVDEEEIDTLGGLIFMLAGRVPARGEVVRHPGGHEFEVIDADPRRIKRMRVRLNAFTPQ